MIGANPPGTGEPGAADRHDLEDVDPFDLPEWLGAGDVVWGAESGLRTAHLVMGTLSSGPDSFGGSPAGAGAELACDLMAVDEAFPAVVATDEVRVRAHRHWRHGQVLLLRHQGRLALAAPGTRWSAEGVLDCLARLAKAVGASPERYAVHLRIGDDG